MRVLIAGVVAALALSWGPVDGHSASGPVLRQGSSGPRVAALQWLLTGHKPSRYLGIKTFAGKPNGYFGKNTARAVVRMKYRLGWHPKQLKPTAGRDFFDILLGKRVRPRMYLARAYVRVRAPLEGTVCGRRVATKARSQVGHREVPLGSNTGYFVRQYQSITGAYHAAWCVSFAQWVYVKAGLGTFADRSAGVFYTVGWAQRRGLARSRPKVGALAAFMNRQGHMGVVVKVTASGFVTVEGNASNRVLMRFHRAGSRPVVFVYPNRCLV